MPTRHPQRMRLAIIGAIVVAVLAGPPRSAAFAAIPLATYRGDVPATAGNPGRKVELRLKADGTMSLLTDFRNNRAPVTEEGRWNPISVEQIDVIIERKDGKAVEPSTLHFVKKGDVMQSTPESSAQFGGHVVQLRQTRSAALTAAAAPVAGTVDATGSWRWEGMVSPTDRISIDQPEHYTLDLQGGGKAAIRADCNRGQAAYKFDGRGVAIRISSMSKSACAADSLADRYVRALEAASTQRLRGDILYLDLPGDGGTMKFVRAR